MMQANVPGFVPTGLGFISELALTTGHAGTRRVVINGATLDSSNNIYLVGGQNNGSYSTAYLAKLNNSGAMQWQKRFTSTGQSTSLTRLAYDGTDLYAVGRKGSATAAIKFNTSGTVSWYRRFDNASTGVGMKYDGGDLYITTADYPDGIRYFRLNTSGTSQQEKNYNDTSVSFIDAQNSDVNGSGQTFVTFYSYSPTTPALLKHDYNGSKLWAKEINTGSGEYGYFQGVAVDSSSNAYVAGGYRSSSNSVQHPYIAKFNNSGTIQWQRDLTVSSSGGTFTNITIDGSNNIFVVGKNVFGSGTNDEEMLLAKYNSSGTLQWQRTLRHATDRVNMSSITHQGSSLYMTGYLFDTSNFNKGLVMRLPDDGSLTGTYGDYTYASSSFSTGSPSYTYQNNAVAAISQSIGSNQEYGFVPTNESHSNTVEPL